MVLVDYVPAMKDTLAAGDVNALWSNLNPRSANTYIRW